MADIVMLLYYCLINHRQADRKFGFLIIFISKIFRWSVCLWAQLCTQGCLRAEDDETQGLKPLQLSIVHCSRTCAIVIATGACLRVCLCVCVDSSPAFEEQTLTFKNKERLDLLQSKFVEFFLCVFFFNFRFSGKMVVFAFFGFIPHRST